MKGRIPGTLILLAISAAATAADNGGERVSLRNGVDCGAQANGSASGETHRCFFSPGKHGRFDFTSRNGRSGYVISALGPNCKEIDILADEDFVPADASQAPLRRVSIICMK